MTPRRLGVLVLTLSIIGGLVPPTSGALLSIKCQAGKARASGKHALCRQKAEGSFAKSGNSQRYADALATCEAKYNLAWLRLEAGAAASGTACPSTGDGTAIKGVIDAHTTSIAGALAGGLLTDCPADLATCLAVPKAQLLKTGQASCFDDTGAAIPCSGTGQDGDVQAGLAPSHTDNGDGTVTDNHSGLMWEKKSRDGGLHDMFLNVSWSDAFAHVQNLNATSFAGYNDWRLPNINELIGLVDFGTQAPAVSSAFNTKCTLGCTVTTCSCTSGAYHYWSSTSGNPPMALAVSFYDGTVQAWWKSGDSPWYDPDLPVYARAVRGGS